MTPDPQRPDTPMADALIARLVRLSHPPAGPKFRDRPIRNRKQRRAAKARQRRAKS